MPPAAEAVLVAVLVLAASVWVGGLVAIFMVARVANRTLGPAERIAFFRSLGRTYGLVGGIALAQTARIGVSTARHHAADEGCDEHDRAASQARRRYRAA